MGYFQFSTQHTGYSSAEASQNISSLTHSPVSLINNKLKLSPDVVLVNKSHSDTLSYSTGHTLKHTQSVWVERGQQTEMMEGGLKSFQPRRNCVVNCAENKAGINMSIYTAEDKESLFVSTSFNGGYSTSITPRYTDFLATWGQRNNLWTQRRHIIIL